MSSPGSILMYLPFVSKSMMVPIRPLAQALVDRGHKVTIISDFPFKVRYTAIQCSLMYM